jgi:hypothetical protein
MIVSMRTGATEEQVEKVCGLIAEHGFQSKALPGEEQTVIAAVGTKGDLSHLLSAVESLEGV